MSGAAPTRITLAAGEWRAEIAPRDGGVVRSLSVGGRPILRTMPEASDSPLDSACFPLVPYANRIAQGRFAFDGADHQLPRNFGDHPHSIHGFGWQASWTAKATGADHVLLVHDHPGDTGWPWPYHAGQQVKLTSHEYRLLAYLMHHGGRVVSRTELVEHLYDQDFDRDSNTIEVFIGRLRKKLGVDIIQTIRGLGYLIAAPAESAGQAAKPAR